MLHRDDDAARFVARFGIPVRLGRLFQRIASVDDGCDLSRFNQLFDGHQIFEASWGKRADDFLVAVPRGPRHLNQLLQLEAGI